MPMTRFKHYVYTDSVERLKEREKSPPRFASEILMRVNDDSCRTTTNAYELIDDSYKTSTFSSLFDEAADLCSEIGASSANTADDEYWEDLMTAAEKYEAEAKAIRTAKRRKKNVILPSKMNPLKKVANYIPRKTNSHRKEGRSKASKGRSKSWRDF